MSKTIWYIFILILVFLLVVYYKGAQQVIYQISSFINNLVLMLQGRDSTGKVASYPTQS